MTPRERTNAAVRSQPVDRVPTEMAFTPAIATLVHERTGGIVSLTGCPTAGAFPTPSALPSTPGIRAADYFGWETRGVGFGGDPEPSDFSRWSSGVEGLQLDPNYGTGTIAGTFHHFTRRFYPLRNVASVADLEAYPWPDFTPPCRHGHLEAEVAGLQHEGWHVSGHVGANWETAWQLIGMERMMVDLITQPEVPRYILRRIADDNCFKARRLTEAGVDMIRLVDDVGMQDRLMVSPALWRRELKPLLAEVIAAARNVRADIPVWYHSDGDVSSIIEDLIEVGVTVLNPVQPECLDLDDVRRYRGRLAFWGTIGTQTTMPFGSPADVRAAVRQSVELFAPGLVLAPTHVLEPEVPWANIVAFHEAVDEYGVFG